MDAVYKDQIIQKVTDSKSSQGVTICDSEQTYAQS